MMIRHIALLTVFIAALIGWVMNIITIISLMGADFGAEIVIRCIGVFAFPLGAIAGYF